MIGRFTSGNRIEPVFMGAVGNGNHPSRRTRREAPPRLADTGRASRTNEAAVAQAAPGEPWSLRSSRACCLSPRLRAAAADRGRGSSRRTAGCRRRRVHGCRPLADRCRRLGCLSDHHGRLHPGRPFGAGRKSVHDGPRPGGRGTGIYVPGSLTEFLIEGAGVEASIR